MCPAPTLFVGKRKRSGQLHCIACWRQFPPGAAWFSNSQLAVQVPPPKRWLRRYSQHQRRRGPAPALVPQDACSSIKGPMRPGRRPWVGADNNDMNPQSISLDSEDDEDVNSTGRSRLTGSDEESAGADTRASSLAPEYSQVQSDMGWDDDTASSSSTGNIVSEPQVEDAAHVTCDCPKWRLRRMESSLVIKLEKIACRQGCAIGGRHKRYVAFRKTDRESMR